MIQSLQLYDALRSHGDPAKLVLVSNAGHGFVQVNPLVPIEPSISEIQQDILDFLSANL
jgi:dipeptidyl aminopeptidase/acylaminoacyl peptidase